MANLEATVLNQAGQAAGKIKLPEAIFGLPWNADLVHQVVTSMRSNQRSGTAHTKDRSEVAGGGRKPWQQKGTGRARHGSSRSPIWIGGGITHGPRSDSNYTKKINRRMKIKALLTILSQKYREGEVFFVDAIVLKEPKTKLASAVIKTLTAVPGLEKLSYQKGNRAIFALPATKSLYRSFRNLPAVHMMTVKDLNPVDVINYQRLIFVEPEVGLKALTTRLITK